MFCYNCGIKLDDKARFCPGCGTKVVTEESKPAAEAVTETVVEVMSETVVLPMAETSVETVPAPVPVTEIPVSTPTVAPVEAARPIVVPTVTPEAAAYQPSVEEKTKACVKKSLSSALFLIATILFTLSVIFSTVSFFIAGSADTEYYDTYEEPGYFDKVTVSEYEDGSLTYNDIKTVFGAVEFADESVLLIIGLFLTYIFAKSKNDMKTGGLATLKVAAGIKIGFSFLFALLIFIAGIAVCGESVPEELIGAVVILVCPLFIAAGVLYVIFCFKLSGSIGKVRDIASTGNPTSKLSGFVGVVLFAIAAINLLSISGNIYISGVTDTGNWADTLCTLTKGVSCLLYGIIFVTLKKKLKSLTEEYKPTNTPAVAGQTIINNNVLI